jgi:hypothetical protein
MGLGRQLTLQALFLTRDISNTPAELPCRCSRGSRNKICVHEQIITYPISPRGSHAPGHLAPGTPPACSQLQCRKLHRFTQLRTRPTVIGRKEQCRCVTGDAQGRGGGGVRGALEGDREPARRLRHPAPLHRPVDQLKRRRETNCEEEGRGTGRGG